MRDPEYLRDVSEVFKYYIDKFLPKDCVLGELCSDGTEVEVLKDCFGIFALQLVDVAED